MKKIFLIITAFVLVFSAFVRAGEIQIQEEEKMTAEKIVQRVIDENKKQMRGIEDMTVIMENIVMYSKFYGEGDARKVKTKTEMSFNGTEKKLITIFDGEYLWHSRPGNGEIFFNKQKVNSNPYQSAFQMAEKLKEINTEYTGDEIIDGVKNYILSASGLEKMLGNMNPKKISGKKLSGKIWVNSQNWAVMKMEMDYDSKDRAGQERAFKTIVEMKDFKRVKTLNIPRRIIMTLPGDSLKITSEQREQIEKGLKNMKEQLDGLPPDQKEMMEKMIEPQMKQMEKMLDGGSAEHIVEITEVKVNSGLSDELFNPELLPGYSEETYDKQ